MISGTGAVVPTQYPSTDPLVVRADAHGNPVSGATVLYTPSLSLHIQALSGNGTVVTDANGLASTTYNAFGISQNLGHEIDTVTATWNGQSAVFDVIITQVPAGQYPASPLVTFSSPSSGAISAARKPERSSRVRSSRSRSISKGLTTGKASPAGAFASRPRETYGRSRTLGAWARRPSPMRRAT